MLENISGTTETSFQVGLEGVKIFQGTSKPSSNLVANAGDIFILNGKDEQTIYQYKNGAWFDLEAISQTSSSTPSNAITTYGADANGNVTGTTNGDLYAISNMTVNSDNETVIVNTQNGNQLSLQQAGSYLLNTGQSSNDKLGVTLFTSNQTNRPTYQDYFNTYQLLTTNDIPNYPQVAATFSSFEPGTQIKVAGNPQKSPMVIQSFTYVSPGGSPSETVTFPVAFKEGTIPMIWLQNEMEDSRNKAIRVSPLWTYNGVPAITNSMFALQNSYILSGGYAGYSGAKATIQVLALGYM